MFDVLRYVIFLVIYAITSLSLLGRRLNSVLVFVLVVKSTASPKQATMAISGAPMYEKHDIQKKK